MNAHDLMDVIGSAKDGYVEAAVNTRGARPAVRKLSLRRVALVAAVILMAMLLVGCTVAYVLRLQELKIGEEPGIRNFDEAGQWAGPTEVTKAVISLRGYPGSPNQLATKEWYEFIKTYDPEKKLLVDDQPEGIPDSHYYAYGCYTKEMAEKVDEIAAKYNLKLLSPETVVQRYQMDVMFEAMGIDGVCHAERIAKPVSGAGYFYPEGNFKYEFDLFLPMEDGEASPLISAYMLYARKDYFDPDYQSMDSELFEEWTYTTSGGNEVLIAMSSWGGYFFGETEDAYITVSAQMAGFFKLQDRKEWHRQCMEQAAEAMDFSLAPQVPDMTGLEEKLAQAEAAYETEQAAAAEERRKTHSTYASAVQKYMDGSVEWPYNREYYALVDVTGDGEPELLLAREQRHFNDILTIQDGKVVSVAFWSNMDLCEDGIILKTSYFPLDGISDDYNNPCTYGFCRIADGEEGKKYLERFEYIDCSIETREWTKTDEVTGEQTPIAREEIEAFLAQYPKLDVEMKPISEFPAEDS